MLKRVFIFFLLALFSCPLYAFSASATITNIIPGKYATLKIVDIDTNSEIDKDSIVQLLEKYCNELNVERMQAVLYDTGKKEGEGIRLTAEKIKSSSNPVSFTVPKNQDHAIFLEKIVGYPITPQALYSAYENNEVVADEDFKGKPILMNVICKSVSKDTLGKAYIAVSVDSVGLKELRIYVANSDPWLRDIKKGSEVVLRAMPDKFSMMNVILNGEIILVK